MNNPSNHHTTTTHNGTTMASSPSMQARPSHEYVPSPRQRPFPRMPSLQQVGTSQSFSTAPASTRSVSSISPSPYLSSVQCSPSAFYNNSQPSNLATPAPLELPESIVSLGSSYPSTPYSGSKPESLMRKLSHGAKNAGHRLRRKASSSNQSRRDDSSGPVARRRSDSKTTTTSSYTADSDYPGPDVTHGLGLQYSFTLPDDFTITSDTTSLVEQRPDVVAPAVPEELVAGCRLTKSTRKGKQDKFFYLDAEGSKVSWSGNMSTKSFQIDNIKSIRTGEDAASQWHAIRGDNLDIDCCFIINYASSAQSNGIKTLHLIAPSRKQLTLWVDTLEALAKHREDLMTGMIGSAERLSILRAHWDSEIAKKSIREGQPDEDGLDLAAISSLCRKLHIHCPRSVISSAFERSDERKIGLLTYEHFRKFVRRLRERVDISPIFNELKDETVNGISRDKFISFLQNTQGVDISSPTAWVEWENKTDKLIAKSSCSIDSKSSNQHIDFSTFASFVSSEDCRIYAGTEKSRVLLDRPMNEYFISSSHNTYLLGRQVNGTSSVEAYVTALRRGCRSVEIDCWDGENDNPRVTHGFTKTTSVLFVDVIHAINRCAFDASPYPVILSLEVHCNPIQQNRMVEIMKEVFGDRLLLTLLQNHLNDLPSPEELQGKILVKVKATEAYPSFNLTTDTIAASRKRSTSSPYRRPVLVHSTSSLQQPSALAPAQSMMSPPDSFYSPTDRSMTATSASSDDDSDTNVTSPTASEPGSRRVKTSKIVPSLASLGTYLQGYSYRGPIDLTFQQFNHIFSLNETTAMTLCNLPENKALFEDHNLKYMCRVYPKGLRVNSSNFDPNTFWRRGVQMVALNYQTYDTHMQMNQAMFAAGSDQFGYVLKPDYLRKQRMGTGPFKHRLKLPRYKISFSVKVISAQQLPRLASMSKSDSIDPFVEVQMFSAEDKARGIACGSGGAGSSSMNDYHGIGSPYSRRTKVVRDNGYNPQFNDLIDLTLETKYPELVFVRFIVYQAGKNSRQLAVFTSKLDSLQCGYRHVPLYNGHGEELIFSTLFCQIAKRRPVLMASSLQDLADRTPRQRSFRTMLTRNLSVERGRERGRDRGVTLDQAQLARQRMVNREIEEVGERRR